MCNEVGTFFGGVVVAYVALGIVVMVVIIQHKLTKRR